MIPPPATPRQRAAPRVYAAALLCVCLGLLAAAPASAADTGPSATPQGPPQEAPQQTAPLIRAVRVRGRILAADGVQGLLRFLDIRPGMTWDARTQSRVLRDLEALGYLRPDYELDSHGALTLIVEAVRTVRRIFVSGHWPLLEVEVLSNLSWRPGYRLPEGDGLVDEIRKQEQDVVAFLHRKGYFDATAQIALEWDPGTPQLVDVRLRVHLNIGFWRLKYDIGQIDTQGFTVLSPGEIRGIFSHCCLWLGRTSTEVLNEDFKQLLKVYQEKGYPGARLTLREVHPDPAHKQVDLKLAIEERKKVELIFTGRKSLSLRELKAEVTIFRDAYYSANEMDESAQKIFQLYQKNGFFQARVSWRWKSRDTNPLLVEFLIDEGPNLRVHDVSFARFPGQSGPLSYSQERLAGLVQTKRYPRLGLLGLGEGGYATAISLDQDLRRLEDFYHAQGFPGARAYVEVARSPEALDNAALLGLQTARPDYNAGDELYVRFRVDEGAREIVDGVEIHFTGPHDIPAERLRKRMRLAPGTPFTLAQHTADGERVKDVYATAGYRYVQIEARQIWNAAHDRVVLRWDVNEGPLVRFGPVLIRGNAVTSQRVILQDLPFHPGDVYSENKLLEAKANLEQRQIFSYVKITADPGRTEQYVREAAEEGWVLQRNPVPVLIEVGERYDNYGEVSLFGGVSSDNLVYAQAGYSWRNILGSGLEGEMLGELGVLIQSLSLRLTVPRLQSLFWRLDLRGFWRNQLTVGLGQVTAYGGNIELTRLVANTDEQGRRLPPTLRFFTRLGFSISNVQVPLYSTDSTGDPTVVAAPDQTQTLSLSVGAVLDRRYGADAPVRRRWDQPVAINPAAPVSGYYLAAQVTGALCCSFGLSNPSISGSFVSLFLQAVALQPFGPVVPADRGWPEDFRRFNFKANLRVNWGIPLDGPALPEVEQFFAGGDTATRGYYQDMLKVEQIKVPITPLGCVCASQLVPEPGNIRILSQIEWEFVIHKVLGYPWAGALFTDTGAVFNNWLALRWNDVRFSVGLSLLRLLAPFGTLSVDYAYPITLPGQDPLLQNDTWKEQPWYEHFPGRVHFNWGMPISL